MIYLGSSPLKNCFIGSTQVKEIYVGSTLYWSSSKTLSVTMGSPATATLKIGGATVKTSTTSFTYDVPYGSSVELTVKAGKYYYIPTKHSDTATYTYSSFEEDTSVTVAVDKVTFSLYIAPAMKDDATIASTTYGGRINMSCAYEKPDGTTGSWGIDTSGTPWRVKHTGGSPVAPTYYYTYSAGPWTPTEDIEFGTKVRPTPGEYGTWNMSTITRPYYFISPGSGYNTDLYLASYQAPGVADTDSSNWATPGAHATNNFYINYIPQYMTLSGTVYHSGYNKNANTTYYLIVKSGDVVCLSSNLKNVVNPQTTLSSLKVPSTTGAPPVITVGISTSSTGTSFTKKQTVTLVGNTSGKMFNLNKT